MSAGGSSRRGSSPWAAAVPTLTVPRHSAGSSRGLRVAEWAVGGLLVLTIWALVAAATGAGVTDASTSSAAALGLSPASAVTNATVGASGSGFGGRTLVQLTWDGNPAGMPAVQTTGNGSFKTTFLVPSAVSGTAHTIAAGAQASTGGNGKKPGGAPASASALFTVLSVISLASPTPAPTATAAPTPTTAPTASPTAVPTAAPTATPTPTPAPTATPTATAAPSPTSTPAPVTSAFVSRCGTAFCLNGNSWYLYGAAANSASMAPSAHLNTVRVTNWLHEEPGSDPYQESRWLMVDNLLAQSRTLGLHVILDFSTYRNFLYNSGFDPYTQNWSTFISFAANRVNTVTGVAYKNDPTIALIGFAGEVDAISGNTDPRSPTTTQLTAFYQTVFSQWRAIDQHHLLEPGGLFHLNSDTGIDWRTIFAAADVCSVHNYSAEDSLNTAVVAAYCGSINRPWITEEFGFSQTVPDATRAQNYQSMYALQRTNHAAGVASWYLGSQLIGVNGVTDTYDVNTGTPLTWNVLVGNAP
jgi:hypothetical protein